jgi:hypothetical protein
MIFLKKLAYLEFFFLVPLSLKTTRNNRNFPLNGPIKEIFPQNLNI